MADVDDYGEWKTGKRITGISFSGNLFFSKWASPSPAPWWASCSLVRLRRGRKTQSTSALNGIVLLFSVIPGIGYLLTAGVVRLLKVDREMMKQIQADLATRRQNYRELNDVQQQNTLVRKVS